MKLSTLRDAATHCFEEDAKAATALADAANTKIQTAGAVVTARRAFAHGLNSKGGRAVDASVSPPILYIADGDTGYTETTLASIDADADDAPEHE